MSESSESYASWVLKFTCSGMSALVVDGGKPIAKEVSVTACTSFQGVSEGMDPGAGALYMYIYLFYSAMAAPGTS